MFIVLAYVIQYVPPHREYNNAYFDLLQPWR